MNEPEAMAGSTYQGALLTSELQESMRGYPDATEDMSDDAGVITPNPERGDIPLLLRALEFHIVDFASTTLCMATRSER